MARVGIDEDEVCFLSRSLILSVSPEYIMSLDMQVYGSASENANDCSYREENWLSISKNLG